MANPDNISFAAASDAARFANDARTEHIEKGSKDVSLAAAQDASRLTAADPSIGPLRNTALVNLEHITSKEAQIIESEEHRALGYKPPPESLAALAQSAAALNEQLSATSREERGSQPTVVLKEAARADAAQLAVETCDAVGAIPTVDLDSITKEEAALLQSEEQKRRVHFGNLPSGSLASVAQSVADRNLTGNRVNGGPAGIDPNHLSQEEASRLMSEEHRRIGHNPPRNSLAAQAQSIVRSEQQ
ncbi:hypothetical protein EW145_g4171 [Phellinidium pouzarii]|uniref:SMP domain-containing protein n=1 Tax=Phellinidium pouzarii TaxID=167371 RepID=A0A4V3XCK8_9AGAM|nr:hypothetical protein EW145_g4171 [Phellinidium pouzarii]